MMYVSHKKCLRAVANRFSIPIPMSSLKTSGPSTALRFGPGTAPGVSLESGLKINTSTRKSPVEVCTVLFLAGSRYEKGAQLGASHFVRALAGASGHSSTKFAKMRHLQQMGAQLTCTSDRQTISYTLCCKPGDFKVVSKYLLDAATCCHFHDWDIDDVRQHVEDDLARIVPQQRVLDLVQTAATKRGLSNSVFCPRHQIQNIDSKVLRSFAAQHLISSKCSISSVGIKHDDVMRFSEEIDLPNSPPPASDPPVAFRPGYEAYDLGRGAETWVALAVPGTGSEDIKCLLEFWVVAAACGVRDVVSCFPHSVSHIDQKPLSTLAPDERVQLRAFNISYIDDGLFGILVRAPSELAAEVAFNAMHFLRREVPNLTCEQLLIGKKRLLLDLMAYEEVALQAAPALAHAAACSAPAADPAQWVCLVNSLSIDSIKAIAQYIAKSVDDCLAVAVVGDLGTTPNDIELLSV